MSGRSTPSLGAYCTVAVRYLQRSCPGIIVEKMEVKRNKVEREWRIALWKKADFGDERKRRNQRKCEFNNTLQYSTVHFNL